MNPAVPRQVDTAKTCPQSAVLAYRPSAGGLEVLLVTSKVRRRLVLPKGMIEPGMTPFASAAKEAWEEAGVTGWVSRRCLGLYRYRKTGSSGLRCCEVRVYPMRVAAVLPRWPEQRQRRRFWMPIDAAMAGVHERDLRGLLATFRRRLQHDPGVFRDGWR